MSIINLKINARFGDLSEYNDRKKFFCDNEVIYQDDNFSYQRPKSIKDFS